MELQSRFTYTSFHSLSILFPPILMIILSCSIGDLFLLSHSGFPIAIRYSSGHFYFTGVHRSRFRGRFQGMRFHLISLFDLLAV